MCADAAAGHNVMDDTAMGCFALSYFAMVYSAMNHNALDLH